MVEDEAEQPVKEEAPEVLYTVDVSSFGEEAASAEKLSFENVSFGREEVRPVAEAAAAAAVHAADEAPARKGDAFAEFDALMASVSDSVEIKPDRKFLLFTTKTCPNCKIIKEYLAENNVPYEQVIAEENKDVARGYGIMQAPTAVILEGDNVTKYVGVQNIKNYVQANLL